MGIGFKVEVSENMLFWTGYQDFRTSHWVRTVLYNDPDMALVWDYVSSFYGWYGGDKYRGVWL